MAQPKENRINDKLSKICNLPALPSIVNEALRMLNDPDTSNSDLIKIISKDQSFITKILTIANSPIYGLRREVSTLDFAILVLGFNEIKNIVFAISFIESFRNEQDRYFNQSGFWLHSFLTANVARRICEDLNIKKTGEAFVAGFLHDFGISILHRFLHYEFVQIYNDVATGMSYFDSERSVLNLNHFEIGEILMNKWCLPYILSDAVRYHHNPSSANVDKELASIVHLADYMCQYFNIGNFEWDEGIELDSKIIKILNFPNRNKLDEFIESHKEFFNQQVDSIRYLF